MPAFRTRRALEGVTVAAHERLARLSREAQLRTDYMHDALIVAEHVEQSDAVLAATAVSSASNCPLASLSSIGKLAVLAGGPNGP